MELESSKKCLACGALNKAGNTFCTTCGINLLENNPKRIEIQDSFVRPVKIIKYLFVIPSFLFMSYIFLGGLITISPFSREAPTSSQLQSIFILGLISGGTFIGFFVLYKFLYKLATKPRNFFISNEIIKISVPKKPKFEIIWDEFDKIEIKKHASSRLTANIFSPRVSYNDLNFVKDNTLVHAFTLKLGWDFRFKTCRKIRKLLKEFSHKLNKEYIYLK
ncbi:MAG: hypothetical protein GF353_25710 [Candidatus Lokiarchaeota archaeon]|nr:hypothetical protein [Candidatus Lokiarchaeota archaeon]